MNDQIYDWQKWLPNYANSDNLDLFDWIAQSYIAIYHNKEKVENWHAIDVAQGKVLDDIGRNHDEYRGEADDEFFRFMIKSKILSSRSKSTANDIINVISKSLNYNANAITLRQDRNLIDGKFVGTPYSISVIDLPLSFTTNDFEKRYLIKTIENSAAAGILVSGISFLDKSNAQLGISVATAISKTYTSTNSITKI